MVPLLIAALALPALSLSARDLYVLTWSGTAYSTNHAGRIIATSYTQRDIIKKCAQDNGITNLASLAFVYVANERDTEVVWAKTGGTVGEIFQLEYAFTDVAATNQTRTVRQAFIFNEAHTNALGSTFGNEFARRDTNGNLVSFVYYGNFQFSIPETGVVYYGNFITGRRLKDTASQQ